MTITHWISIKREDQRFAPFCTVDRIRLPAYDTNFLQNNSVPWPYVNVRWCFNMFLLSENVIYVVELNTVVFLHGSVEVLDTGFSSGERRSSVSRSVESVAYLQTRARGHTPLQDQPLLSHAHTDHSCCSLWFVGLNRFHSRHWSRGFFLFYCHAVSSPLPNGETDRLFVRLPLTTKPGIYLTCQ